jgi:hypothetical protein
LKDIPGFPGYKITPEGKIFNSKGKQLTRSDEWQGYPRARLKHESGDFKNRKIHTLVALAYLGKHDSLKEIRHLDNNRSNFHLHNLSWGDRFSNAKDRLDRGSYHLNTKVVNGKSLLVLGNDKYLDPEAKKIYHVTDSHVGEDGVIPVTSLEKVSGFKESFKGSLKRYKESLSLIGKKKNCMSGALKAQSLLDSKGIKSNVAVSMYPGVHAVLEVPTEKGIKKLHYSPHRGGFARVDNYKPKLLIKSAEWTSKKNADKHAKKHANEMSLTKEEYIEQAKKALKGKLFALRTKNDTLSSRDEKGNILVHKDGKVISYYTKKAYIRRVGRVLPQILDNDYNQDIVQTHLDIKDYRKKKKHASVRQIS